MARPHREDHVRYRELLEESRDGEGIEHRDEAIKLLAQELAEKPERFAEFANSRAVEVADRFDSAHKPETAGGQMALDIETYLVIGDSERVGITRAKPQHTRQWIDVQQIAKAKHDAAHAAKMLHGYKLLAIQDEHNCSMWDAEQIFRNRP